MEHALTWLIATVFSVTTLVMIARALLHRTTARTSYLAAAAFGSFALILAFGTLIRRLPEPEWTVLSHGAVVLLVLFPWFLQRFAAVFRPPPGWTARIGDLLTAIAVAGSLFYPLSREADPAPPSGIEKLYLIVFVAQWICLLSLAGALLWAAGHRCPRGVQLRMRVLSVGTVTLGLALLSSAVLPSTGQGGERWAPAVFCLIGAFLFHLGLAAPRWLSDRIDGTSESAWVTMTQAIIQARDAGELWSVLLPVVMNMAGATAGCVTDAHGELVHSRRMDPMARAGADGDGRPATPADSAISLALGEYTLQLTARSSVIYFRDAERPRLEALCALADLALQRLRADATEQARANRELLESRNLAETILTAAADAILTVDRHGTVTTANPAAGALFAFPRERLVGTPLARWIADLPEPTGTEMSGPRVHDSSVRDDRGAVHLVEMTVSQMADDDERLTLYVLRDITARRQSQQALRDGAARLDAIVSTAVDGILTIDERGIIETVNRAAEELFGYSSVELVGDNISVLMPEPTRSEHDSYVRSYVDTGERKVIGIGREVVGRRKDGTLIDLELAVSEMYVAQRRMFTGILRDISGRKRAEADMAQRSQALARSNAELQQFAYIASHDLQEPLRKVASYVQIIATDYGDKLDDDAKVCIGFAVDGAQRMRHLIEDLLAVSRVTTEAMRVHPCDVTAILRSVLEDYTLAIGETGADIQFGELPQVLGDEAHIRQLFQNLISNSIKYRSDRPLLVRIAAHIDGDMCRFTVADNGIGFKQQYSEKVFGMFQRLVGRTEYPGTGMGLAICAKVVENHGGTIAVESEPGVGTTFRFSLPMARELAVA